MRIKKIAVLGLGKVGTLVAGLLNNSGFKVSAFDIANKSGLPFEIIIGDVSDPSFLEKHLKNYDAVVSCLPYSFNKNVAAIAFRLGLDYFDLTEDVETADYIQQISDKTDKIMAPQCGLAPGFIAIVGADLAKGFDKIYSIELRVGALPQNPKGDLGYAFNWSAEGVVNECLNDCNIISENKLKTVPAMQDLETIVICGKTLEAFSTSGGLGTMCQSYKGKVQELSYKTIRYPGHMKLMRFFFHELKMKQNRKEAGRILLEAKPPVNNDVVYVYAAVEGWKGKNALVKHCRDEFVKAYYPQTVLNKTWRAITWTTACSICSVVELAAQGKIKGSGFIKQEDIALNLFLNTKNGSYYNAF